MNQYFASLLKGEDHAFKRLYDHCYKHIRQYILNNSGDESDAEDVFQEAITVLYKKVKEGKPLVFDSIERVCAYLYSISKNIWLKKLRKSKPEVITNDVPEGLDNEIDRIYSQYQKEHIIQLLFSQMGKKCKKILSMHYFDNASFEAITETLGYENPQTVHVNKARCLKKLREIVKENTNYREL